MFKNGCPSASSALNLLLGSIYVHFSMKSENIVMHLGSSFSMPFVSLSYLRIGRVGASGNITTLLGPKLSMSGVSECCKNWPVTKLK